MISRCHLLNVAVPDGVASCDLGQELGCIGVEVLDDGLLTWLVVNDGGSSVSLKSHCHGHRSCFGLLWVLRVKLLHLDGLLVQLGVVENYNTHHVLEFLGVLKFDQSALPTKFVLGLLSSFFESLLELKILLLCGNNFCTFFSNLVGSTGSFDLKIDFLSLLLLLMLRKLLKTFLSYLSRVLVSFDLAQR